MDADHGQEVGQAGRSASGSYPRPALPGYMLARVLDFRLSYLTDDGRWTYDPREAGAWPFSLAMQRSKQLGRCLVLISTPVDEVVSLVELAEVNWIGVTPRAELGPERRRAHDAVNKVLGGWEREVRQVSTTADDRHRPG